MAQLKSGSTVGGQLIVTTDDARLTHSDTHDASIITVADTGNYFAGMEVEAVLQEIGALLQGVNEAIAGIVG